MIDKELVTEQLNQAAVQVTFTKVDGTERVMKATLKPELIPDFKPAKTLLEFGFTQEEMETLLEFGFTQEEMETLLEFGFTQEEMEKLPKVEPKNQSVWDLDKKAWRSFRWDSVKETRVLNGE